MNKLFYYYLNNNKINFKNSIMKLNISKIIELLINNDATLLELNLNNYNISFNEIKYLSEILQINSSLTKLNISHNNINVE